MKKLACFLMSVILVLGLTSAAFAEAPDMSVLKGLTVGFCSAITPTAGASRRPTA